MDCVFLLKMSPILDIFDMQVDYTVCVWIQQKFDLKT